MRKLSYLFFYVVVIAPLALMGGGRDATAQRQGAHITVEPINVPIGAMPRPANDPLVQRVRTDVQITVDGDQRVARVEIEDRFRNNGGGLLEGDYLYPIPPGAVFTDLSLFMGEQELKGEMLPAGTARGIYEEVVRRKKDPALIELVDHGHRALLVRQREVAAGKAEPGESAQRRLHLVGMHLEGDVSGIDAVLRDPVAVQARRARVRDRPAHDAGDAGGRGVAHRATTPCPRRKSRSASSGRPRMAK